MKIEFNKTGAERKALVKAMGEILEVKPKYLGMPTANYEVDCFTVTKNGTVEFDDRADRKEIENLLDSLAQKGFVAVPVAEKEQAERSENSGFTVAMPLDKVNVENLKALISAKSALIKKSLGVNDLPIVVSEGKVTFPWFSETDAEAAKAYTHFISALCEMSREHKITAKEKSVDNEKYAFRCFLLRLGFIGAEYKEERKILIRNLTGSSAFKSTDSVTTICYGKTETWSSRKKAEQHFLEAMSATEGSERERYTKIYTEIIAGNTVCTDEE